MNAWMFALTGIGLTLLALAMPRHYNRVFHKNPQRKTRRGLRACGWLLLAFSLGSAVASWREGAALVLWFALLAFHAFVLAATLAYRPRWMPFWAAGCGMALIAMLAASP